MQQRPKKITPSLCPYNILGPYDPSNEQIQKYNHKKVTKIYQKLSEDHTAKTDTLLELYKYIQRINRRIEIYKNEENKDINKK